MALAACGDSGNATDATGTATDSSTTEDDSNSNTDPSNPTPGSNSNSESDTDEPTVGTDSNSGQSDPTTTTDPTGQVSATDTEGPDTDTGTDTDPPDTDTEADPECGNGVQEGAEECDDGNDVEGDGCEPGCVVTAECGNGVVEAGEACDDGNQPDDVCSDDCLVAMPPAECGNGTTEDPELCDDGNDIAGDGCEPDCTITPPECGNGVTEAGEQCDDGNNTNGGPGDFCKNDCTTFFPASCNAPAEYVVCDDNINLADKTDRTNALKAMGICNDDLSNSVVTTDFKWGGLDPNQPNSPIQGNSWQVAKGFGSYMLDHDMDPATPDQRLYSPREGSTFLMISTGTINAPNNEGIVTHGANTQVNNGNNFNPDDPNLMPAPMTDDMGSNNGAGGTPFQNCDGVKDCSDSLFDQWNNIANGNPQNQLWFTFKTVVPEGTFGYTFDFAYCSSEWPFYVNSQFNDLLVAWQVDPSADDPNADPPVDPYTGNVTFIPDPNDNTKGLPVTITALDPYFDGPGYTINEPQLAGTGFDQHACTDWFVAKGGVQPGAEIEIGFYITDMGDQILATLAILDNWRWDCEGCVPSEVDDCGVMGPM